VSGQGAFSDAWSSAYDAAEPLPPEVLPEIPALSRVELEPVLAALVRRGTPEALADAEVIREELASRTWQNQNPYATT